MPAFFKRLPVYLIVFLITASLASLLTGCAEDVQEEVLARVNGEYIEKNEVLDFLNLIYLYSPDVEDVYRSDEYAVVLEEEVLWFLIENRVLQQEIRNLGLQVDEERAEKNYLQAREELIEYHFDTEEDFLVRLEQMGMDESALKQFHRDTLMGELLRDHVSADVTEEDARDFVEENPLFLEKPASVYAYHILVESEDEAEDIVRMLDEGANFVELGREYSLDSFVELGKVSTEDPFDPIFLEAAFSLEPGEISGPVRTAYGYHVIQITEREEAGEYSFEEVRENALDTLRRMRFEDYFQRMMMEAEIETYID